ncbi:MAG: hypothetical protein RLZ55_1449 [Actinomycetota bacterium]
MGGHAVTGRRPQAHGVAAYKENRCRCADVCQPAWESFRARERERDRQRWALHGSADAWQWSDFDHLRPGVRR